jgi:hypothetical protein
LLLLLLVLTMKRRRRWGDKEQGKVPGYYAWQWYQCTADRPTIQSYSFTKTNPTADCWSTIGFPVRGRQSDRVQKEGIIYFQPPKEKNTCVCVPCTCRATLCCRGLYSALCSKTLYHPQAWRNIKKGPNLETSRLKTEHKK